MCQILPAPAILVIVQNDNLFFRWPVATPQLPMDDAYCVPDMSVNTRNMMHSALGFAPEKWLDTGSPTECR